MNNRCLRNLLYLACGLLWLGSSAAHAHDAIPGAPQTEPIALVGGKIFPISGPPIDNGTVLFDQGRIVAVGVNVKLPKTRGKWTCAASMCIPVCSMPTPTLAWWKSPP
jgi:hypothetical protein